MQLDGEPIDGADPSVVQRLIDHHLAWVVAPRLGADAEQADEGVAIGDLAGHGSAVAACSHLFPQQGIALLIGDGRFPAADREQPRLGSVEAERHVGGALVERALKGRLVGQQARSPLER